MSAHTSSRILYQRLLSYVWPYRGVFVLALLAMVITAATEPLLPALLKPMLDRSFVHKDPVWMARVPFLLIGLFLVRGVSNFCSKWAMNWVGQRLVMDIRSACFERLLTLPRTFLDNHPAGTLISKISYDSTLVMTAATNVVTNLVTDSCVVVGLLSWLFYINWRLSSITLFVAPPIALAVKWLNRRLRHVNRDHLSAMGELTAYLNETLAGHRVIQVFGGQPGARKDFFAISNHVRQLNMKHSIASALSVPIVQFFASLAIAIIVWMATRQASADETTVGAFVSFITAMIMLLAPLKRLSDLSESLQRGLAASESVFRLIDEEPEQDLGTEVITHGVGEVVFSQVCFQYPEAKHRALNNFSLTIKAGQTVALVGASGSGKSTVANLLPRLYQPQQGVITLDGYPIEQLTLASLRSQLALVSQDVVLFNDSVRHNIAYGISAGASNPAIEAAARAAYAWDFIQELPEGLDTPLGENGSKLSGGQRQRIAIARALLKNAPVLILDEATSALDRESERSVQAALEMLMRGRTTLVIAHRLATIEKSDWIVVMDQGEIREQGTHQELLMKNGWYSRLLDHLSSEE
ncbi:MAG: lipid A export permease/ATP-binding protein MsbA [Ferrovum sp.]|nr:lipid A export permease/ATP-binding protein MsbA [Ferrovum sp.]